MNHKKPRINFIFDPLNYTVTISDFIHYVNIIINEKDFKKNQKLSDFLGLMIAKFEMARLTVLDIEQQRKDKK